MIKPDIKVSCGLIQLFNHLIKLFVKILSIPTSFILLLFYFSVSGQPSNFQAPVSINEGGTDPDKNAMLDIQSTNKGLLIPRMPYSDIEKMVDPAEGLMIYDTEFHCLRIYMQGKWHCLYQKLDGPNADLNITGWANPTSNDSGNTSIAVDSKENVLLTKMSEDEEIQLTKYDNKGNLLWNIYESANWIHHSVVIDLNDYIFTIAASAPYLEFTPTTFNGATSNDVGYYITKTSPDGKTSEIFTLPNSTITELAIDKEGNILFAFFFNEEVTINNITYFDDTTDNIRKVGIAKLDNNFNVLWVEVLDVFIDNSSYFDYYAIDVDERGNVYIAGKHDNGVGPIAIEPSEIKENNIFITCLVASNGKPLWTSTYGSEYILSSVNMKYIDKGTSGSIIIVLSETDELVRFPKDVAMGKIIDFDPWSGNINSINEIPGFVTFPKININHIREELAITFSLEYISPTINSKTKLLIYDYHSFRFPKKTIDQTFHRPGNLSYNKEGSKIYGIARGEVAGNTIIYKKRYVNNHLIYKVYNE